MRRKWTSVLAVVALVATSGIALAADDPGEDTVFNYGYDEDNAVFLWNQNPTDGLYDCSIGEEAVGTKYSITEDGLVLVDELTDDEDAPVAFDPTPEEDLADDLEPQTDPFEYAGADEECGVSGGEVAGPNGQINHGMFMKLFNSLYEGKHRGCVIRNIAKSDLGKGDQQVKVSDVDPEAEGVADGDIGTVTFESIIADCDKSDKGKGQGQEKAAEKKAAKEDRPRGKSADAPGRNK